MREAREGDHSVDRAQLRQLLRLYMRLAFRGTAVKLMGGRKGGPVRVLVTAMIMQVLVGLGFGMLALTKVDVFSYSLLVAGGTFFMVGLTLVSEAGDVLFNRAETDVLGHRPIPARTLLIAKSLSLVAFALMLALALNFFPSLFGLAATGARGWFPLAHVLSTVLLTATCAALVVFVHGLLGRFVSREKIDNWAAWAQVSMSVVFVLGYQIVPRLAERLEGRSFATLAPWLGPLPPTWSASLDAVLAGGETRPTFLVLATLGVLVPAALAHAALGRLATSHGDVAASMLEQPRKPRPAAPRAARVDVTRWPILRWWLRDPVERASFRLATAYMARDREIRTRLYPQLAMMVMFPLLAIVSTGRTAQSFTMASMSLALVCFLPSLAAEVMGSHTQHAAAGVFTTAPIASAAPLFHGVRKAAFVFLVVPSTLVVGCLVAVALPDALGAWLLVALILPLVPAFSLVPAMGEDYYPLSKPPMRAAAARNMAIALALFIAIAVTLLVGRVAIDHGWYLPMLAGVIVLGLGASALLRRRIDRRVIVAAE